MQHKTIKRQTELGGEQLSFYEVFTRRNSKEPLTHIGSIDAPNDELAEARAWFVYDQEAWLEMCIVRTSAVTPITERDRSVKMKVV